MFPILLDLTGRLVVVVGGGAVGCGVAYALAKAGQRDVLLLERGADVGQVTTSQGAGLCGQARDSVERVKLAMHSVATFRERMAARNLQVGRLVATHPTWCRVTVGTSAEVDAFLAALPAVLAG